MSDQSPALTPEYIETHRFNKWVELVTDPDNKETFSNGTRAMLVVNPSLTYAGAAHMAWEYKKKLKYMGNLIAEKRGITFEKFFTATWNKFVKSDKEGWWDRVNMMAKFVEEDKVPETQVNIISKDMNVEFIGGENTNGKS